MDRRTVGAVLAVVVGLAAVLAVACGQPTAPTPITINNNNTNTNTVTQTITGGLNGQAPLPATGAGCEPVATLGMQIPVSIPAGQTIPLDATPHSAPSAGNGTGQRSDACNLADGIVWSAGPSSVCSVNPLSGDFTPNFRAIAAGTCAVTACVKGVCASGFVTVQ